MKKVKAKMTDPQNPPDDDSDHFPLPQSELIGVLLGGYSRIRMHEATIYKKREYDARAQAAVDFVSRWGMVAAVPDGVDDAGRQKLRLATEMELVGRAIAAVGLLFDAVEDMGWYVEIPDLAQAINGVPPDEPLTGNQQFAPAGTTYVTDAPPVDGAAPPSVDQNPPGTPLAATPENAPQAQPEGDQNAKP